MIRFGVEHGIRRFEAEARALFVLHYTEIVDQTLALKYSIHQYEEMERREVLLIHTLRDDDDLIGYHFWLRSPLPRHPATIVAQSDILYVRPDRRRGLLGYRFLKDSINHLQTVGVHRARLHVKPARDYSALLRRMGAKQYQTSYEITLEQS